MQLKLCNGCISFLGIVVALNQPAVFLVQVGRIHILAPNELTLSDIYYQIFVLRSYRSRSAHVQRWFCIESIGHSNFPGRLAERKIDTHKHSFSPSVLVCK